MIQDILSIIFVSIILGVLVRSYHSKDKTLLFSPIVFICIFYLYYIVYPYFFSEKDFFGFGESEGVSFLLLGGIINIIGLLIGFSVTKHKMLVSVNKMYDTSLAFKFALAYFFIGFVAYSSIKGFHFNIVAEQTESYYASEHRFNHTDMYVTSLISLFPTSACLFYASGKWKYNIPLFLIAITICIIGGSRNRILLFLIPFIVFYHLYPEPKKINFKLWIPIAFFFVVSMGVIEKTRNYSHGLDLNRLLEIKSEGFSHTKASESEIVYYFSAKVMDKYQYKPLLYKDVVGTAICLPIPRTIFPSKPDAQYLRDANVVALGTEDYGAAYLNIVEWYLAFGWIGIFFNGFILGWLSKKFWNNYVRNPQSIGAIIFLGLFDGVCYILISRGYLAQEFVVFTYYIIVNYWIGKLVLSFVKKKKYNF